MYKIKVICIILICIHGVTNRKIPSFRIIGGSPVSRSFPDYHVSIQHKLTGHFCGGSIISSNSILTAAHCFEGIREKDIKVVVGTHHLYQGGTSHSVKCIKPHKKFQRASGLPYDIAIVVLDKPILPSEKATVIKYETSEVPPNTDVILTGWNLTTNSNSLVKIHLKIAPYLTCKEEVHRPINDRQICTIAKKNQGPCVGDSGNPLVKEALDAIDGEPNYVQVGIMSWGEPCATGTPDVQTKVWSYSDWISKNVDTCKYRDV